MLRSKAFLWTFNLTCLLFLLNWVLLLLFTDTELNEGVTQVLVLSMTVLSAVLAAIDLLKVLTCLADFEKVLEYFSVKLSLWAVHLSLLILHLVYGPVSDENRVTYASFIRLTASILLPIIIKFEFYQWPSKAKEVKKEERKLVEQSILPFDRVLWILNDLKSLIDSSEKQAIKDIDYCLKIITNNKIFTPDYDDHEMDSYESDDFLRKDDKHLSEKEKRIKKKKVTKKRVFP